MDRLSCLTSTHAQPLDIASTQQASAIMRWVACGAADAGFRAS